MAGYVDMKLDYSFKKAFSDREQLRAFLNDMLRGERVVKKVEPRNPEWLPSSPRNRKVLVDVYCTDEDGTHFIVEMQYAEQKYFKDRACSTIACALRNKASRAKLGSLIFCR